MSGRRPIEFIQAARPIVIIDEPQSVDNTSKSRRAIQQLQPVACFRYSATHINPYNLLYKLDPIKAYDLRLVKRIEVSSVKADDSFNDVFVRLDKVDYAKGAKTPHARVTINVDTPNGPKTKTFKVKQGDDLYERSNQPPRKYGAPGIPAWLYRVEHQCGAGLGTYRVQQRQDHPSGRGRRRHG